MRRIAIACLACSLTFIVTTASAAEQQGETRISLDLANIRFSDAIAQLAKNSKLTYVIHPQVKDLRSSNIRLDNVPLSQALRVVLAAYGV